MKIIIRLFKKGDGSGVIRCFNNGTIKGINEYTGSNTLSKSADARALDKQYSAGRGNNFGFIALDPNSRKIVGACFFFARSEGRTRHRGEVSCGVDPDYLMRGIGTKLLKKTINKASKTSFERIEAEVAKGNTASIKLVERCGFKMEGIKREGLILDDGTYMDVYVYGMLISKHGRKFNENNA